MIRTSTLLLLGLFALTTITVQAVSSDNSANPFEDPPHLIGGRLSDEDFEKAMLRGFGPDRTLKDIKKDHDKALHELQQDHRKAMQERVKSERDLQEDIRKAEKKIREDNDNVRQKLQEDYAKARKKLEEEYRKVQQDHVKTPQELQEEIEEKQRSDAYQLKRSAEIQKRQEELEKLKQEVEELEKLPENHEVVKNFKDAQKKYKDAQSKTHHPTYHFGRNHPQLSKKEIKAKDQRDAEVRKLKALYVVAIRKYAKQLDRSARERKLPCPPNVTRVLEAMEQEKFHPTLPQKLGQFLSGGNKKKRD